MTWESEPLPEKGIAIFVGTRLVKVIEPGQQVTADDIRAIAREHGVSRFDLKNENEGKYLTPSDFPMTAPENTLVRLVILPLEKVA